jgi:hypothetical protein
MRNLPKKLDQLLRRCVHRFHHDRLRGRLWLRLAFDRLCKEESFLRSEGVRVLVSSLYVYNFDRQLALVGLRNEPPLHFNPEPVDSVKLSSATANPARGKANRKMCINRIFALSASASCSPSFAETKVVNVDEEAAGGFCQLELSFSVLDRRMLSKYSSVKVGSA